MLTLLLSLIPFVNNHRIPTAQVEVESAEIEAVFIPAGYEGPIVAAPWDESAF